MPSDDSRRCLRRHGLDIGSRSTLPHRFLGPDGAPDSSLATSGSKGFIDTGADMVTVQSESSADVNNALVRIREQGAAASLGV